MDLEARGAAPLAWRFLNDYLEQSGDYDGLRLLTYYAAYHAFVRAKIAKLARDDASMARYFEAGERNLAAARGILVLMHGYSGSGKTTVAESLIEALLAVRIRSHLERKRLAGLPPDAATGSGYEQGI